MRKCLQTSFVYIYLFLISDAMVGDVNLFFNEEEDLSSAEIEIMIAGILLLYEPNIDPI